MNRNQQSPEKKNSTSTEVLSSVATEVLWTKQVYHEMSDVPVTLQDPFAELEMNLAILQDMNLRLAFMNREIRYLLKV